MTQQPFMKHLREIKAYLDEKGVSAAILPATVAFEIDGCLYRVETMNEARDALDRHGYQV
jgi:hypothetical protein